MPAAQVPPNFRPIVDDTAVIGAGVMWRRPWSREQVTWPVERTR